MSYVKQEQPIGQQVRATASDVTQVHMSEEYEVQIANDLKEDLKGARIVHITAAGVSTEISANDTNDISTEASPSHSNMAITRQERNRSESQPNVDENNAESSMHSASEDIEQATVITEQPPPPADGMQALTPITHKIPNSYKYPQLKQFFQFGAWVGRNRKALCLGCKSQTSSSQPDRLLKHLKRCPGTSEADKELVVKMMNERSANKRSRKTNSRSRKARNGAEASGDPNSTLEIAAGSESDDGLTISSNSLKRPRREHASQDDAIDEALARWIVTARIPLKTIHSREFEALVRALNPNYRIPNRETITNVLIPGLLNIL